jgi:hypothetical protein
MTDNPGDLLGEARPASALGARAHIPRALRGVLRFLVDWFPVFILLFVYDGIHNRLGRFLPSPRTLPQIHVEQALFGATIPTVRMQRAFYSEGHPHWWDFATLAVYNSHFFVPVLIALTLWFRSRPRYLKFLVWFGGMTTLGYLTYVLFPAVPPWMASQNGDLAPTHRLVRELWDHLGRHDLALLFSGNNIQANDIAAIPSLHAAYPVMIAIFFWESSRRWMKIVLALYPLVMAVALVYAAEHYILDIMIGWLYVLVTALAMRRLWRGR